MPHWPLQKIDQNHLSQWNEKISLHFGLNYCFSLISYFLWDFSSVLLKSMLNLPYNKALTGSSVSTQLCWGSAFAEAAPREQSEVPLLLLTAHGQTRGADRDTRTPAECNSKQHEGLVACIAQITENKLQWAWTYIFLNRLRTSPGIAELSWNISGRRRKRIWAGLARNFSLNHMARNCSMFLSWSLRIYFMHIIPWSSWCSIS